MDWSPELEPFQYNFVTSKARFPAMVAAWGTGKTMCAIMKAMQLSIQYPGNLGLVVRKNFTDLKDSTMKDFRRYTGIKVPSSKDVRLANGSEIMFRHMDELSGVIQNVNLGWFFIEQMEEFDTPDEFDKLDGRLRRENCFRQGFGIANANGHNWIWRRWINKGGNEYMCDLELPSEFDGMGYTGYADVVQANTFDNKQNLPPDFLGSLKVKKDVNPGQYRRYVMNSHEDTDTADVCIPYEHLIRAVNAEIFCLHEKRRLITCDPAEFGNDKTIIMAMEEGKVIEVEGLRKKEPMDTAGRIIRMRRKYNATLVAIDSIGIGAGIRSRLGELGENVVGVNSGMKSSDPDNFRNIKAEMWMNAQEQFRENKISLPDNDELIEDLAAHKYLTTSRGQISIEKKDDTKKRLGRSPDMGDAFVLGLFALKGMGHEPVIEYDEEESELAGSYSVKTLL